MAEDELRCCVPECLDAMLLFVSLELERDLCFDLLLFFLLTFRSMPPSSLESSLDDR